jgi:hypothetical protein
MLAGTPRLVGENQAGKRKHRTEVTEATEKVMAGGLEMLSGTPRLVGGDLAEERNKSNR